MTKLIGLEPNQVPLNQFLGSLAYQGNSPTLKNLLISSSSSESFDPSNAPVSPTNSDLLRLINPDQTTDGYTGIYFQHKSDNVAWGRIALHGNFFDDPQHAFVFTMRGGSGSSNNEKFRIGNSGTIHFKADLDTYITGDGANAIQVYTSGTEKLRITGNGNVGIGTTNPTAKLHVFSPDDVSTAAYFRVTNSSVGSGTYKNIWIDGTHPNGASLWKGIDITPSQATLASMTGIDMSWYQIYQEARGVNINIIKNTHAGGGNGIGVYSRVSASGVNDRAYEAIAGWFITDKETGALDPYTSYPVKIHNKSTTGDTNLLGLYTDSSTQRLKLFYDRTNKSLKFANQQPDDSMTFYNVGSATVDNVSFYFQTAGRVENIGGTQYGIKIDQGGARYTNQTALYATHTNTIGNFAGNYRGVHGVTTFGSQAGGTTESIFGETTIPVWNYQGRHCGVRGIAIGGGTDFYNTYGLGPNNGAFGGHFVAYGKADVCGVYADAYHLESPGAGTQSVPLIVATNGSQIMRVTSDKYLRMMSGSGGIQFGGDTAAANALDDYEEGTWTPVPSGSTIAGTYIGGGAINGRYTKIGNAVTFTMYIAFNSGNFSVQPTGNLLIGGLPFTTGPTHYFVFSYYSGNTTYTAGYTPVAFLLNSSTTLNLTTVRPGGTAVAITAPNSGDYIITGTYLIG